MKPVFTVYNNQIRHGSRRDVIFRRKCFNELYENNFFLTILSVLIFLLTQIHVPVLAVNAIKSKNISPAGSLDPNFGIQGQLKEHPTGGYSTLVVDGDHMFLSGAETMYDITLVKAGGTTEPWIEKRSIHTGTYVQEFGDKGILKFPKHSFPPAAMAIQGDYLYALISDAGFTNPGAPEQVFTGRGWHLEKRNKVSGKLERRFGRGGKIWGGDEFSTMTHLVVDGGALYIVGFYRWEDPEERPGSDIRNSIWRIEKYSLSSGAKIKEFGDNGIILGDPDTNFITETQIHGDFVYLGGPTSVGRSRIEKRSAKTGELDSAFGGGGKLEVGTDQFDGFDLTAFDIDTPDLFIGGIAHGPENNLQWRLEKRSLETGKLDPTFGSQGVIRDRMGYMNLTQIISEGSYLYILGQRRPKADGMMVRRFKESGKLHRAFAKRGRAFYSQATINVRYDDIRVPIGGMALANNDALYFIGDNGGIRGVIEKRILSPTMFEKKEILLPDLIISNVAQRGGHSIFANTSRSIEITILNLTGGWIDSPKAVLRIDYDMNDTWDLIRSVNGPSDSMSWTEVSFPTGPKGIHKIEVCADPENTIQEISETNNCSHWLYTAK